MNSINLIVNFKMRCFEMCLFNVYFLTFNINSSFHKGELNYTIFFFFPN
jgi:hypothetical protein